MDTLTLIDSTIVYCFKFMLQFFILTTTVFGVSSMLLYGSVFESFRQLWFRSTGFLADLFRCQLCLSMWVALGLQWLLVDYIGPCMYFFIACSVAGISWLLGAFTQAALWQRALHEKWYGKK